MGTKKITDYTEQEFVDFVNKIKRADFPTESAHDGVASGNGK